MRCFPCSHETTDNPSKIKKKKDGKTREKEPLTFGFENVVHANLLRSKGGEAGSVCGWRKSNHSQSSRRRDDAFFFPPVPLAFPPITITVVLHTKDILTRSHRVRSTSGLTLKTQRFRYGYALRCFASLLIDCTVLKEGLLKLQTMLVV